MLAGGKINIENIGRISRMDKCLSLAIPVEDVGEQGSKTIDKF
jgi:hypothetical protein